MRVASFAVGTTMLGAIATLDLHAQELPPFASTDGVEVVDILPCENSDANEVDCWHVLATVDYDDPDVQFDDALLPNNVVLTVRVMKGVPLTNRWIAFAGGGDGIGFASGYGQVPPGGYESGNRYGDDLIRWYNDAGFVTLDVSWVCTPPLNTRPSSCSQTLFDWIPTNEGFGEGWFRNTGGTGFAGAGSRVKAIYLWAKAHNGNRKMGAHGNSGGSGRLVTLLTRYEGESLLRTVVFDGGPTWAYTSWYCNVTKDANGNPLDLQPGPLGQEPVETLKIRGGGDDTLGKYDLARDDNNGESDENGVYDFCMEGKWDKFGMLLDSNFVKATQRTFNHTNLVVVLGGGDTTPAPATARLWFQGYSYQRQNIPPLSARSVTIIQGFCDPESDETYRHSGESWPCSHWLPENFPTADAVIYDPALWAAGHPTANSEAGATALFNAMLATLTI